MNEPGIRRSVKIAGWNLVFMSPPENLDIQETAMNIHIVKATLGVILVTYLTTASLAPSVAEAAEEKWVGKSTSDEPGCPKYRFKLTRSISSITGTAKASYRGKRLACKVAGTIDGTSAVTLSLGQPEKTREHTTALRACRISWRGQQYGDSMNLTVMKHGHVTAADGTVCKATKATLKRR